MSKLSLLLWSSMLKLESLIKVDGNGEDSTKKQWSDWFNGKSNHFAPATLSLVELFYEVCEMKT